MSNAQICLPITNNPVIIDGIVVGYGFEGSGTIPSSCSQDAGWFGINGQQFTSLYNMAAIPPQAHMFISAKKNPDLIYIGIHVEDDPSLSYKDRLVLFFDANNNGWDNYDFTLVYEIGGDNSVLGTELCNQNISSPIYYKRAGSGWSEDGTRNIEAKLSWDYTSNNDGEDEIWELEIKLNVADFGLNLPAIGNAFKMGAVLYLHQLIGGEDSWDILGLPNNMPNTEDGLLYEPSDIDPQINQLEQLTINNCADVILYDVTAMDAHGTSNKFTRDVASIYNTNSFSAQIKMFNPSNPSDNAPLQIPNDGTINYFIKPWNLEIRDFSAKILMKEQSLSFDHFNQIKSVAFNWPTDLTQYNSEYKSKFSDSHHSCLEVRLSDFNLNLNQATDVTYRNLTYSTASLIKDKILISTINADSNLQPEENEYIFRLQAKNIPSNLLNPKFNNSKSISEISTNTSTSSYLPSKLSRDKISFKITPLKYKSWDFKFKNSKKLGLTSLGDGYYSMPLAINEKKIVNIAIEGGEMPNKPMQIKLSPKAGGTKLLNSNGEPPVNIDVKPGQVISLITNGLIAVNKKEENGPNGFIDTSWVESNFLLDSNVYEPHQHIGALIASFDDFQTSFLVGNDITFYVPQNANKIYFAVNDTIGAYDDNTGAGFEINVYISDRPLLPTKIVNYGDDNNGIPPQLRGGINLPEFNLVGYIAQPNENDPNKKLLKPTGYVTYSIYNSHPKRQREIEILSPFIGYTIFDDKLDIKNNFTYGLRIGCQLYNELFFEIEGAITPTNLASNGNNGNAFQAFANIRHEFYQAINFSTHIVVGGGYIYLKDFGIDDESFAINGGLGTSFKFNKNLALRADLRYLTIKDIWTYSWTKNLQGTFSFVIKLQ